MGINLDLIKILDEVVKIKPLGNVLTLGRQGLSLTQKEIKYLLKTRKIIEQDLKAEWCDEFLIKYYGANSVVSLDVSSYEGASILHDMNCEIMHANTYDTVIDAGTTEHIFNIATAFRNIKKLTSKNGIIVHAVPSNNYCGHGFYQFSPSFYDAVYSRDGGYELLSIYLSETGLINKMYKYLIPKSSNRVVYMNKKPTTIFAIAQKKQDKNIEGFIQQSDYLIRWGGDDKTGTNTDGKDTMRLIKRVLISKNLNFIVNSFYKIYRYVNPFHGHAEKLKKIKNIQKIE